MGWISFGFAVAAGAFIAVQAGSNSQLKKALGVPLPAVIVNYLVGITSVMLYAVIRRVPLPSAARAAEAPWWAWLGGAFGAVYGVAAVILASQMGAATLTALVLTGQLVCSVVLDHFGWFGFDVHPAGIWRIVGCALMIIGLGLIARF